MTWLRAASLLLAASCSAPAPLPPAVPGAPVVYEGARLIVGDGAMIENGALVVRGARLEQVGTADAIPVPEGATRVDLRGKTVMPTLIDAHLHLGFEGYTGWGGANHSRATLVDQLERLAYYGIGAAFSPGTDPDDFALELQRDQRAGRVGGARYLFAAGMAPPGAGPNPRLLAELERVAEEGTILRGAGTPEQGREAVREVARQAIPFVKIWVDSRGGTQEKLPPEVYRAIIDEARRYDVRVVVHHESLEDMKELARTGVDGFLHGRFTAGYAEDDELIRLVRESGAFVIPNLGISELRGPRVYDDSFFRETVPAAVVERLRAQYPRDAVVPAARQEEIRRGMTRFAVEGIPIVLGTDAGAVPDHFFGYAAHEELGIYVRSGLTPMQALVAGTGRAAEALGLEDMGTLAAGKSADFIVLDANPLEDIANTRRISRVFLRGREIDREALRRRWRPRG